MNITVLGATGATGRRVVEQLLSHGHTVRGIVRASARTEALQRKGVETAVLDLAAPPPRIAEVLAGSEVVVNTAASRSMDKKGAELVDHEGVVAVIDAAATAGVKRWIQLSMWGTGSPTRLPGYLRATGHAKLAADDHLSRSDMNWTVVRPPWLTDEAPTGRITVGNEVEEGSIGRDDLAAVLVATLDHPATYHRVFEVTGGGLPIAGALDALKD